MGFASCEWPLDVDADELSTACTIRDLMRALGLELFQLLISHVRSVGLTDYL